MPFSLLPIQRATIFSSCPSERDVVTVPRTSGACDLLWSLADSLSLWSKVESIDPSSAVAFLMLLNEWHHVTSSAHHGRPAEFWGILTHQEATCVCHQAPDPQEWARSGLCTYQADRSETTSMATRPSKTNTKCQLWWRCRCDKGRSHRAMLALAGVGWEGIATDVLFEKDTMQRSY